MRCTEEIAISMEPVQVGRDPACAEVIVLAEVENLADDLSRGGSRRPLQYTVPITQSGVSVFDVTSLPFVGCFPRDPEPTACSRDVPFVGGLS
jgi:hypothetical protein